MIVKEKVNGGNESLYSSVKFGRDMNNEGQRSAMGGRAESTKDVASNRNYALSTKQSQHDKRYGNMYSQRATSLRKQIKWKKERGEDLSKDKLETDLKIQKMQNILKDFQQKDEQTLDQLFTMLMGDTNLQETLNAFRKQSGQSEINFADINDVEQLSHYGLTHEIILDCMAKIESEGLANYSP